MSDVKYNITLTCPDLSALELELDVTESIIISLEEEEKKYALWVVWLVCTSANYVSQTSVQDRNGLQSSFSRSAKIRENCIARI